MPLENHDKKAALAEKYGWKIMGWAVDLDNPAGISLESKQGGKFLRFQHKDSLKEWEKVLKANKCELPKGYAPPKPIDHSKDLVQIPRAVLDRYYAGHQACEFIANLEAGSRGAYSKFKQAQDRAREALGFTRTSEVPR